VAGGERGAGRVRAVVLDDTVIVAAMLILSGA